MSLSSVGYHKLKLWNVPSSLASKCVKYINLRLQIKFPRSVLNLTCIVHSPEVPAAIFWKHNGQVFFLLSYHIFTFLILLCMFFLNCCPTLNYGSFAAARSRRRWNPDGGRRLVVSNQVVPLTRTH